MDCTSTAINYSHTGYYNQIVTDYVAGSDELRSFYEHPVSEEGIRAAIAARQSFPTDRAALVNFLQKQYEGIPTSELVKLNIARISSNNTFTICTAHQPNIFTGYLYFIYKIIHVIKLADHFRETIPSYDFVPVFYLGNEDADLEELGKIFLNGEKLVWDTKQKGAVGRMKTTGIEKLIARIDGELSVQPHGKELMQLIRNAYIGASSIQEATFRLVNELFSSFGLVVLVPDDAALKKKMEPVFKDDLLRHIPSQVVAETTSRLAENYKVQANPREINTFYLRDDIRNRIEKKDDFFHVVDTDIKFTEQELLNELELHPERFSPNVILRGLYQEMIMPNIAFVGGGGELAYWLELKDLFHHYKVPYPVQVLRNSFLLIEEQCEERIAKLDFVPEDFFREQRLLLDELVKRDSAVQVHLTSEIRDTRAFYEHLRSIGAKVDNTLLTHITALETRMLKQLQNLEKKLLRAEKRKFSDQSRQIETIRKTLFPNNGLQERVDNFMPWYAKYGAGFLNHIYDHSLLLDQKFILCSVKGEKDPARQRMLATTIQKS
ncbi:bacillithiol biosynthesis cysteine-adding enzyme BshC [Flavihumibacter sediminis]|nr:bacillithiol biosynthesis cysteine-adding enzyme BshC [Flavihumibacter sediminis]